MQRLFISWRNQNAGFVIDYQIRDTAYIRSNHWDREKKSIQYRRPKPFIKRRKNKEVKNCIIVSNIIFKSGKFDIRASLGLKHKPLFIFTFPQKEEVNLRMPSG